MQQSHILFAIAKLLVQHWVVSLFQISISSVQISVTFTSWVEEAARATPVGPWPWNRQRSWLKNTTFCLQHSLWHALAGSQGSLPWKRYVTDSGFSSVVWPCFTLQCIVGMVVHSAGHTTSIRHGLVMIMGYAATSVLGHFGPETDLYIHFSRWSFQSPVTYVLRT